MEQITGTPHGYMTRIIRVKGKPPPGQAGPGVCLAGTGDDATIRIVDDDGQEENLCHSVARYFLPRNQDICDQAWCG